MAKKNKNHRTQEWAIKNINCCTGRSHNYFLGDLYARYRVEKSFFG